jgi:ABC-type bacteriocin/lantibiotic exporter with double-glycine peptidase domain
MDTLKKIFLLLNNDERKHASLLIIMITIMALLDMIGVASILPFVAVLTNPGIIETNIFLKTLYEKSILIGVKDDQNFLFVLGIIVFILLTFSLIFKAITNYLQVRFVYMREYSIGKRLVEGYLFQPYSWFLSRNSAELGKTILSEVQQVIGNGIKPLFEIIAKSMIAIALIILLLIVDPKLTLIVGFSLGGSLGLTFYFIRSYLNKIGNERLTNNLTRFKSVSEAFGATKEIKVGNLELNFIEIFTRSARNFAKTQASSEIIGLIPRFILEAIAFGGILLIILFTMKQSGSFNNMLPILSLYIFAGYRLMPALQQIYGSSTSLAFVTPSVNKLYAEIQNLKKIDFHQDQKKISFSKSIDLNNICFNYPDTSRTALKDINFNIPINSSVGLVGATGSGKTTTIDIILGLLEPQKGSLKVDGKIITKHNIRLWQSLIGYVPQNIYLSDDTIASNIAFGIDPKNINLSIVEKVSKIANLHEFIIDELPKKYQTIIGERGVRLSGGQRQRIGIARALYHSPKVLILDEATNALDNQTEKAVMDAVNNLGNNITLILITHRLSTVKNFDKIFLLDKGQLKYQGKYEELILTYNELIDSSKNIQSNIIK